LRLTACRAKLFVMNERGQYGDRDEHPRRGPGGVVLVLGLAVTIYASSPGARHFYKHGRLPPVDHDHRDR
jgi:hypothetical protein